MHDSLQYPIVPPATNDFKEIVPGIYWIRLEIPIVHDHINVWAIDEGESWTLIDTGANYPVTIECWQRILQQAPFNRPISKIIVTHMHPDHVGLAGWFNEQFDTPIWMSRLEYHTCRTLVENTHVQNYREAHRMYRQAGWTQLGIDNYTDTFGKFIYPLPQKFTRLVDNSSIEIGNHQWQIINVGGHTPEHSCLYCPELKLMFSGDQVLPLIAANIPVLFSEPEADPMTDWLSSLDKIQRCVPDDTLVLPAHDDCFYGLHFRLEALRQRQSKARERILNHLSTPRRVVDMFPAIFRHPIDLSGAKPIPLKMATGETLAQLNYLLNRGEIIRWMEDGVWWYAKPNN